MPREPRSRVRRGLTLIELLVVVALDMLILSILAYAFATASDMTVRLKAIGDLDVELRDAAATIRHDLSAYHFEGIRRLSDPAFWDQGPPREGFFRIWQGSPGVLEGRDSEGIESWRSVDHALHFTVRRTGNRPTDFLWARVPVGSPLLTAGPFDLPPDASYREGVGRYTSQWAEVAYFLRPTGSPRGVPAYALYRRQALAVPNTAGLNIPASAAATYLEVSARPDPVVPGALHVNTPMDLTVPQRRFGMDPARPGGIPTVAGMSYPTLAEQSAARGGADLLLTDVLSFDVRVLVRGGSEFVSLDALGPGDNPVFAAVPGSPRVFDTWSQLRDDAYDYSAWSIPGKSSSVPRRLSLNAIQITLRVWNPRLGQAKQVTIVQDL
jgi:hypothetical protein